MGFGGSVVSMIITLRNNANMLRKRVRWIDGHPLARTISKEERNRRLQNLPTATPQQLKQIRDEYKNRRKTQRIKRLIGVGVLGFVVLVMSPLLFKSLDYPSLWRAPDSPQEYYMSTERNMGVQDYIDSGFTYESRGNSWLAYMNYKKAVELRPDLEAVRFNYVKQALILATSSRLDPTVAEEVYKEYKRDFPDSDRLKELSVMVGE